MVASKDQFRKPLQCAAPVQAPSRKYFAFPEARIRCMSPPVPLPLGGAARDRHGRWRRDAMDAKVFSAACRADESISCGRAKSCGPDAPTLASSFALMMGDAMEANKPGTPGRPRISRKPSRRECRLFWLPCCCLRAQSALFFARKAHGCGLHPAFPVPSDVRGHDVDASLGRVSCRENVESYPPRCLTC